MRVWASPRLASPRWFLVALMLAAACDEPDASEPVAPQSAELEEAELKETVVYESQWVRMPDGEIVDFVETGVWTPDLAERVARPWLHAAEGVLHDETSWFEQDDDGTVVAGYRVTMHIVEPVPPAIGEPPASVISEDLQEAIASDEPGPLSIAIELELPPPPPLPFLPHRTTVSSEDYAAAIEARRDAAAVQEEAFEASAAELVTAVGDVGGTVEGFLGTIGFLVASVPVAAIETLAEHADVRHMTRNGAGEDGTDPVPLGDLRTYTGVQAFHNLGYDGQLPGFNGELRLGIMEASGLEDEACFLGDNSCSPNQRLNGRFKCLGSGCTYAADFADGEEQDHGTWVTSIAIADYTQGQAAGHESSIAPGLSNWQSPASGGGKEVEIQYYRAAQDVPRAKAYDCARGIGPTQCDVMDAVNQSNGENETPNVCNPTSFLAVEAAMENAWDDGVLPVVITHNDNGYPNNDACRVRSPADMPKALSVGGIDPDDSAPYSSWAYWNQSNRGGGTSKIGLINHANAMSMVDLVASVLPGYVTGPDGDYGIIDVDGPYAIVFPNQPVQDAGTSFAGPQVAAASLLVMHRYLDLGLSWIASPGRLHAAMLTQGDRATLGTGGATIPTCISGSRILCGADRYFGLGRLTLRPHNLVWGKTKTFTSFTPPSKDIVFGPVPTGYDIVKCTVQQREDMVGPNKSDISQIRLRLQVRSTNFFGICAVDQGTLFLTRDDAAPDVKHMVTVLDSETDIEGRCIQITQEKLAISSAGSVTVHTHCVADDQLDY